MLSLSISLNTSSGFRPINLLPHSSAFDLWTPSGVTVSQNVANDPARDDAVADRMAETAGLTVHSLTAANINVTSGVTYTFSVYVKAETAAPYVQLLFPGAAFGFNAWGDFDIQNGALGTMGSSATGAIEDVGNGWYRISLTAAATATATASVVVFGASSATMGRATSYSGSTSNTCLLANAQVEVGPKANMYVATA